MKLPCCSCPQWNHGYALTEAAQLRRHNNGEPGDDTGTVLGFRLLYGIEDRPTKTTADTISFDGRVNCPGHQPRTRR